MSRSGPKNNPATSVFVGNIPYDVSEEKLREVFAQVGQVVSFRLVYDRDTGKPKGYGFCEYADGFTAMSAMRNLNGYEINGRAIRVDFAEGDKKEGGGPSKPVPDAGMAAAEDVVKGFSPSQLVELLRELKGLAKTDPEKTKALFSSYPSAGFAVMHSLKVLGVTFSESPKPTEAAAPILGSPASANRPLQQFSQSHQSTQQGILPATPATSMPGSYGTPIGQAAPSYPPASTTYPTNSQIMPQGSGRQHSQQTSAPALHSGSGQLASGQGPLDPRLRPGMDPRQRLQDPRGQPPLDPRLQPPEPRYQEPRLQEPQRFVDPRHHENRQVPPQNPATHALRRDGPPSHMGGRLDHSHPAQSMRMEPMRQPPPGRMDHPPSHYPPNRMEPPPRGAPPMQGHPHHPSRAHGARMEPGPPHMLDRRDHPQALGPHHPMQGSGPRGPPPRPFPSPPSDPRKRRRF